MTQWLVVGAGGFVGAIARYSMSAWIFRGLPVGTLIANLLGCLLIGFLSALSMRTGWPSPLWRTFLISGMLGSLTTFSTFAYQTVELGKLDQFGMASLNLILNLALGLLLVWIGIQVGGHIGSHVSP